MDLDYQCITEHSLDESTNEIIKHLNLKNYTCLIAAAFKRNRGVLNLLMSNGSSLLHFACEQCDIYLIKMLLKLKININILNSYDETPINFMIRYINDTPVNEEIFEFLLENGANIELADMLEIKPLENAINYNRLRYLNLLLKFNVKTDIITHHGGGSVIHLAIKINKPEILKILLNNYVNIESKNSFNQNGLYVAIQNGNNACWELLINFGAKFYFKNSDIDNYFIYLSTSFSSSLVVNFFYQTVKRHPNRIYNMFLHPTYNQYPNYIFEFIGMDQPINKSTNYTYLNILLMDFNKCANLILISKRFANLINYLRVNVTDLFPIYGQLFLHKLNEILARKKLFLYSHNYMKYYGSTTLPIIKQIPKLVQLLIFNQFTTQEIYAIGDVIFEENIIINLD